MKRIDLEIQPDTDPFNEVNVLKSLNHPNIIKYHDAFVHNHKICLLMEYAENGDLLKYVKQFKNSNSFLVEQKLLNWFTQITLAIHYLHSKQVIHRDIKLQNIFLSKDNIVIYTHLYFSQIKLGDFSISKIFDNTIQHTTTSVGTPYYLSPEVCSSTHYNHKIDIWGLGCVLYELATFEKPFQGDSINVIQQSSSIFKSIIHQIMNEPPNPYPNRYSKTISQLLNKLLDKNPDNRPDTLQILQIPEINMELRKILKSYKEQQIDVQLEFIKYKPANIQCPEFQESTEQTKKKTSPHSIHYLIEKAKEKYSPKYYMKFYAKTPSYNSVQQSMVNYQKQFTPNAMGQSKINYYSSQIKTNQSINNQFIPQNEVKPASSRNKKKISINTQQLLSDSKRYEELISGQRTELTKKSFAFANIIFNQSSPTSPNRTILFSDFLRRKLGDRKFNEMRKLLVIREQHKSNACIKPLKRYCCRHYWRREYGLHKRQIFRILISSSITPPGSHFRTKSVQQFQSQ